MLSVDKALSYKKDAIGIGRKGTIDHPYILFAPFWTVDTLFYSIPKENFDINFLYDIFQTIDWKSLDESTGVPSLSKVNINNIEVRIPYDIKEQQTIGDFFQNLDNLITEQKNKLENLQKVKKSMLCKMFPKEGQKVPEIRFKGFEGDFSVEVRYRKENADLLADYFHLLLFYFREGESGAGKLQGICTAIREMMKIRMPRRGTIHESHDQCI